VKEADKLLRQLEIYCMQAGASSEQLGLFKDSVFVKSLAKPMPKAMKEDS
jgi:hypothetical protein